jgi:hypothetical protein
MRRLSVALAEISAEVEGVDGGMGGTLAGPGFMVYYSYFVKEILLLLPGVALYLQHCLRQPRRIQRCPQPHIIAHDLGRARIAAIIAPIEQAYPRRAQQRVIATLLDRFRNIVIHHSIQLFIRSGHLALKTLLSG